MCTVERGDGVEGALSTVLQAWTRWGSRAWQGIVWHICNNARSLRWRHRCHGCFGGSVSLMRMAAMVVGIDAKRSLWDRVGKILYS